MSVLLDVLEVHLYAIHGDFSFHPPNGKRGMRKLLFFFYTSSPKSTAFS